MAKKGFLNRIGGTKVGSIFVSTDEDSVTKETFGISNASSAPVSAQAQTVQQVVPIIPTVSFRPAGSANVDPEIRTKIEQIAKSADQISFTKFSELLATMKATFPGDENAAYRAALNAAKTFSYPVREIVRGLEVILGQLAKTKEQFKSAVPARISAKVGSRRQKIAELQQTGENTKQSIANVQAELGRLQAQITKIEGDIQTETLAISHDEQTIREDEAKFMTAMQDVESVYLTERQKIEQYGKEA